MTVPVFPSGGDDTTAIQTAVTTAQATGDEVLLNAGVYHTSAVIKITDRVTIRGVGYQDDASHGYSGSTDTPFDPTASSALPLLGTVILPGTHDTFEIFSQRAVKLCDFQISYHQTGASTGMTPVAAIRFTPSNYPLNPRVIASSSP